LNSEENNGYVVFKLKIYRKAEKRVAVRGEVPHPFRQQSSGHMFKDDFNSFSSTSGICFIMASNEEKSPAASSKYMTLEHLFHITSGPWLWQILYQLLTFILQLALPLAAIWAIRCPKFLKSAIII
jgi:hypothetical protein